MASREAIGIKRTKAIKRIVAQVPSLQHWQRRKLNDLRTAQLLEELADYLEDSATPKRGRPKKQADTPSVETNVVDTPSVETNVVDTPSVNDAYNPIPSINDSFLQDND